MEKTYIQKYIEGICDHLGITALDGKYFIDQIMCGLKRWGLSNDNVLSWEAFKGSMQQFYDGNYNKVLKETLEDVNEVYLSDEMRVVKWHLEKMKPADFDDFAMAMLPICYAWFNAEIDFS